MFSYIYHNMTYIGLYWHTSRYRYSESLSITRIDCLEFLCWMGILCCNTFKTYEELLITPVSKKTDGTRDKEGVWKGSLRGDEARGLTQNLDSVCFLGRLEEVEHLGVSKIVLIIL